MFEKLLTKEQVFTIPNLLSFIRILFIPIIIKLYCFDKEYYLTVGVIALSVFTDILDGIIARKCNMVSDFGKIIDPFADKLTQMSIILCLASRYKYMYLLILLFVIKELLNTGMGMYAYSKTGVVNSAKWYGKRNTGVIYLTVGILILFPEISLKTANTMIIACGCIMAVTMILYMNLHIRTVCENNK